MIPELRQDLLSNETDVDGAIYRFGNNETLYMACLGEFLNDQTFNELDEALKSQSWDDAFTAAHALKGVSGNMGFIPLFHASAELVILIRTGKISEVHDSYEQLKKCYNRITITLRQHCSEQSKGD